MYPLLIVCRFGLTGYSTFHAVNKSTLFLAFSVLTYPQTIIIVRATVSRFTMAMGGAWGE